MKYAEIAKVLIDIETSKENINNSDKFSDTQKKNAIDLLETSAINKIAGTDDKKVVLPDYVSKTDLDKILEINKQDNIDKENIVKKKELSKSLFQAFKK